MKEKELKKLVDDAVALHREIAEKSDLLKGLKSRLIQVARENPDDAIPTESGGKRWTVEGNEGCIARVSFPAPGLVSEVEEGDEKLDELRGLAGDKFRKLFTSVKVFQPASQFRAKAIALLPNRKAEAIIELCENEVSPRVSFETASSK